MPTLFAAGRQALVYFGHVSGKKLLPQSSMKRLGGAPVSARHSRTKCALIELVVREESRIVYGCRIILGIAAIDFAGIPGVVVDFLAKSNEGFRRIGSRDSLLKAMLERRFGCGHGNGERRASRICFALGSIRSST
jgi:hypothetical protein